MSTYFNAQIDCKNEKYTLQFETENREWYKQVEKACQKVMDAVAHSKQDKASIKDF